MLVGNAQVRSIAMLGAGLLMAVGLWTQGYFLGALLVMLVVGGIATARPEMDDGKVVLRGTPIIAMFAIMFVSASGMTIAINEVTQMFTPEVNEVKTECEDLVQAKLSSKSHKKPARDVSVF